MKRTLIVIVLFIVLVAVVVVFVSQKQSSSLVLQPTLVPTVATVPTFPIQALRRQPYYQIQTAPQAFPATLPAYALQNNPFPQSLAASLAGHMGFAGSPSSFPGSRGVFYYWQQGEALFSLGGDPLEISYTSGAVPSEKITRSLADLELAAESFLHTSQFDGFIPTKKMFEPIYFSPKNLDLGVVTTISEATVAELHWRYVLDGFPLFAQTPNAPGMSIRLNANGAVLEVSGYFFPSLTKTGQVLPVVPIEIAEARLTAREGILVHAFSDEDKNIVSLQDYVLSTSVIRRTELGYYYSSGATPLAPVYIFYGEGIDRKSKKLVQTTTVVQGLPDVPRASPTASP